MSTVVNTEKDIIQYFRPGCYATIVNDGRVILVKKMRWPFQGMYDLPGGGIEHGEDHRDSIIRELDEEIGLKEGFGTMELAGVFKHVIEYEKNEKLISQHIIAIVYKIEIDEGMFSAIVNGLTVGSEVGGDAGERIVLKVEDIGSVPLTPICKQALETVFSTKK